MQAVMLEKVFYSVPHKLGMFDHVEHQAEISPKDDDFKKQIDQ